MFSNSTSKRDTFPLGASGNPIIERFQDFDEHTKEQLIALGMSSPHLETLAALRGETLEETAVFLIAKYKDSLQEYANSDYSGLSQQEPTYAPY